MIEEKIKKPKLDFIVIGFTRCATTWIYNCLTEHPDICVARPKESDFFIKEDLKNNPKRIYKYNNFFNHCMAESVVGEVSPMYIEKDVAFENILNNYPNVKLLVLLRSPLDREISILLYKKRFSKGGEFNLEEKLKRRVENSNLYYSKYLKKWFDNFPRENILPVILENISKNPEKEIKDIYSFLGIDEKFIPESLGRKSNKTHGLRFPKIQKVGRGIYRKTKLIPVLSKFLFIDNIKNFVNKTNRKQVEKPKISEDLENDLRKYFLEDIKVLEELLNKDLSIWK